MDQLPPELKVVISQYLDNKSKINIRATNSFWRSLCQLDSFIVYGATSENISGIIGTYSKIQQPISISFKKFKRITINDFADQVTKLTNLTSLEFQRIPDRSYWRDLNNPWLGFQVMTQLTLFKPCRNKHPFQIYLHLTKLKEFTYNEASWDRDDDRFHARRCIKYTIPLLSQLESLELHVQYIDQDPFGLVVNPSRLTQLLLAGSTYNMIINEESLKRFINLKKLKLDISLPIELKHFTALEDLKYVLRRDISCSLEHNTMLTRLVMTCQTVDEDIAASFKQLTNMKKLDLRCINTDNDQIRKDSLFECLSLMTRLQSFKINSSSLLSGEFFSFVNTQNLKTIQWSFNKDVDVSPLATISSLRVLVLNQLDKEASINYDPISKLTNVTCLKITGISSTHNSTFISTLTMLKVLEIESTNGFGADLNFSTLPDLVSLDILGTTSADVLTTLYSTNITRLCCSLHPGSDYDQLLEYPLRHLRITNDNEEFLLWKTALEQMTSLRRLVFFKIYDFKKLLQLTTLTNLKVLEVTNLKKIPTSYYTKLKSLKKVICYGNTVYNTDE